MLHFLVILKFLLYFCFYTNLSLFGILCGQQSKKWGNVFLYCVYDNKNFHCGGLPENHGGQYV